MHVISCIHRTKTVRGGNTLHSLGVTTLKINALLSQNVFMEPLTDFDWKKLDCKSM